MYFRHPGWRGLGLSLSGILMTAFFFVCTLFLGASLLNDWTDEEERAKQDAIGDGLRIGCAIVVALLLLVGVIWLVKKIWYAV